MACKGVLGLRSLGIERALRGSSASDQFGYMRICWFAYNIWTRCTECHLNAAYMSWLVHMQLFEVKDFTHVCKAQCVQIAIVY